METNQLDALSQQIGGSHYKMMPFQPISLITTIDLDFFQGNVVKYVSRYKLKDGVRDIENAKHYCLMAMELDDKNPPDDALLSEAIDELWDFIRLNKLDYRVYMILMDAFRRRWRDAISNIDELIRTTKQA